MFYTSKSLPTMKKYLLHFVRSKELCFRTKSEFDSVLIKTISFLSKWAPEGVAEQERDISTP